MSYIKKEFIERLLDKVSIEEVVGDFVKLKRSGANLKGLSPFVDEKSPSFMVSPVKQIYKDFSSGKGGNTLNFIMEHEKISYPEAIEYLAKKYNETVEYENSEFAEKKAIEIQEKEKLRPVLKAVHKQYQEAFLKLEETHPAKKEIYEHRQYNNDVILEWGIGYAPENFLYDLLKNSGRVKQGEELGLINYQKDKYYNRVIYPIHDANGLLIGLAGRDLSGTKGIAKWINPAVNDKNILYNKSKVWFGLHKARTEIRKKDEAFIVEGYNDVIALHNYGIQNVVAPCGTAITEQQIQVLSKLSKKVVFLMDPDKAGLRSVIKHTEMFLRQGFRVDVITLDLDPDDFVRQYHDIICISGGLYEMVNQSGIRVDGFRVLIQEHIQGSEIDKSAGAKYLSQLIADINEDSYVEIYRGWIAKESKVGIATIKKWIKEYREQKEIEEVQDYYIEYELPKNIKIPFKELESDIKHYGLFMANNQIFFSLPEGRDGKIHFSSMSNFEIEVLQHMLDEKFPMKLIRIKNIHGLEKIFDTQSENLNTPQAFDNTVTGHGNFRFDGNRNDLLRLRTYLFDKMGNGRKIDVLGWQPDGQFWAWNNKITTRTGEEVQLNEHGIFVYNDTHYYIPSANQIYKNNSFKFDAQKRFRKIDSSVSIDTFFHKVKVVHRDHAISAILFGIASLFQDIVVEKMGNFPILFFYGPGSSGKDELSAIVQSFVGIPQTAINLEGGVSTMKAQVREFAQFRNGISQLSEYKRGNSQLDGMLKALWDRRGYKRGNIESHVGTDSVPIESAAILTGNDFPNEEPLILRTIWNEMVKNEFNQDEMKAFDELKDMREKGVSGFSDVLLKDRIHVEDNFEKQQRNWKGILQEQFPEAKSRIISNLSIIACIYTMFKDKINFPFTQQEMLEHFKKGIDQQIRKINSASILNRFWDCFISSLRGNKDQRLQVHYVVNVEANQLFMNWTHTYAKIQVQWLSQYREVAPSKSTIKEQIEKSGAFIEDLKVYSYDTGRNANRTSAMVVNLDALSDEVKNDIIGSIEFQLNEISSIKFPSADPFQSDDNPVDPFAPDDDSENLFSSSPATPNTQKIIRE